MPTADRAVPICDSQTLARIRKTFRTVRSSDDWRQAACFVARGLPAQRISFGSRTFPPVALPSGSIRLECSTRISRMALELQPFQAEDCVRRIGECSLLYGGANEYGAIVVKAHATRHEVAVPASSRRTTRSPFLTYAAKLYVVPRSIPTTFDSLMIMRRDAWRYVDFVAILHVR